MDTSAAASTDAPSLLGSLPSSIATNLASIVESTGVKQVIGSIVAGNTSSVERTRPDSTPSSAVIPKKQTDGVGLSQVVDQDELAEHVAHMRRRLFRTLEHPERPSIGIDCGSVSIEKLRLVTSRFLNEEADRDEQNLVLAVPMTTEFSESEAFDIIQIVKGTAFDRGLDAKVSWLLIHEPDVELTALSSVIAQQGGSWHAKR